MCLYFEFLNSYSFKHLTAVKIYHMNALLKKILPHIFAVIIFATLSVVYFPAQMKGKVVQQSDIVSNQAMSKEIRDYRTETGETPRWTGSMFSGMPTFQIVSSQPKNKLRFAEQLSRLFITRPIGDFISAMLVFYLLMIVIGVNPWLGIICSIAFGLSTNGFILFEAGHTSKLRAIQFFPMILAGMILTYRKRYLAGGLIFTVGLAIDFLVSHPQMTYYLGMLLGILVIFELVKAVRKEELPHFFKASSVLGVATVLALLTSAANLYATYDYSKDTMRGDPILESATTGVVKSSSETKGLDWEYAMQWSNGIADVCAIMIPGVVGGGHSEKVGKESAVYKDLVRKGARLPANFSLPLYWGPLPINSGPAYIGIVICFLFIIGLIVVKGPMKWWLAVGALFTILLSMGKNLAFFNELFFYYFPLYNKFRAPSSILGVTGFLVPILGALALSRILYDGKVSKAESLRALKIAGGIMAAFCLFFAFIGPSMFSFSGLKDAQLGSAGYDLTALVSDRKDLMRSDSLRSLAFVLLTAGLIWAFLADKLKAAMVVAGIGLLITIDLWTVNKRYLNEDNFVTATNYKSNYKPRPADEEILKDKDLSYRVYDISIDPFNSAIPSYHHKTIGGYHPAKLQRYQDLIERHIGRGNERVLNMLNTRYFITREQQVQRNPNALGNAWFVNSIKTVTSPNEEIDALQSFNPGEEAVVNTSEFGDYISGFTPQKSGGISLTAYSPDILTYSSKASSEQLAVFSEIWYGPDKGWNAYVDGQLVDHIRVNYALRAMKIPAGDHTIEFKFEPRAFMVGDTISLISSLLIVLAFFGYFAYMGYQRFQVLSAEAAAAPVHSKPATPLKKTKSKRKKK